MRKVTFIILSALILTEYVAAQTERLPVAVFPFVSPVKENKARASQIQQIVVELLRQKSGIELIDRSNDSMLITELDFQIREQSVAAKGLVAQGKLLGARQMIVGTVSNVTVEEKTNSGINILKKNTGSKEYAATVNFALQLSDVETGKVINQKAFSNKDAISGKLLGLVNVGVGNSKEESILNAIKSTRGMILSWLNESYPPDIRILKIDERDKKGYPETILITGIDAIQKGSQVIINEVEMFDAGGGKSLKRTKKMAELRVKEVQGEITICKVTEGEKDLEEKLKAGTRMEFIVKSGGL